MNTVLFHNPSTGAFVVREPVKCQVCKAAHYLLVNRWGRTTTLYFWFLGIVGAWCISQQMYAMLPFLFAAMVRHAVETLIEDGKP